MFCTYTHAQNSETRIGMWGGRRGTVTFQVISAAAFKEKEDYFGLEKHILALSGSLAKYPCRFNGWSVNTYKMEFNWNAVQMKRGFRPRRGKWKSWVKVLFSYWFDALACFIYSWSRPILLYWVPTVCQDGLGSEDTAIYKNNADHAHRFTTKVLLDTFVSKTFKFVCWVFPQLTQVQSKGGTRSLDKVDI